MILVVADTSPLNYLVQIEAIGILPRLFDQVVIPETVHQELLHPATPDIVRRWAMRLPEWAVSRAAHTIVPLDLDRGETEAIALARELNAFAVLLDDGSARAKARALGISVTGTIGLLERAAMADLLNLPEVIKRLRLTNYYASSELLQAALERDAERRRLKND